jgi:hypothetical protein
MVREKVEIFGCEGRFLRMAREKVWIRVVDWMIKGFVGERSIWRSLCVFGKVSGWRVAIGETDASE